MKHVLMELNEKKIYVRNTFSFDNLSNNINYNNVNIRRKFQQIENRTLIDPLNP